MVAHRIVDNGQHDLMSLGTCDNTAMCIDKDGNSKIMGDATETIIYKSKDSIVDCQSSRPLNVAIILDQGIASGIYVYRIEADGFVQSKKMILLR